VTGLDYVHGYSGREAERLTDQADALAALLHDGVAFPAGESVLEPGCGVGSQTVRLAAHSPRARIVSVDLSEASLREARRRVADAGFANVTFRQADIHRLPFEVSSFDHVFVCFLLEHLAEPALGLAELRRVLRPGGSITVVEGDHGSAYFHPDSSLPQLVEGFTLRTFTAMVEGVRAEALEQQLISESEWERGVDALHRTAEQDGVFCYTFFRAVASR
jgi:ubiquinone/menaquinone biosynthesis C-methylase UbiE